MTLFANHGNGTVLVDLADTVDSGIGGHSSANDEVFVVFHDHSPFYRLDMRTRVLKIDQILSP
jgi:hypothetical protein